MAIIDRRLRHACATALAGGAVMALLSAAAQNQTADNFRQDFESMSRQVASTYAYFDGKATSWADMSRLYEPDLQRITTRDEFVGLLERVLDELYDPHAQLTTNTSASPRLVPSGTDLWAEWRDGAAVITEVRAESDAQRAGIRPGDIVTAINNVPIADAVELRLGRTYPHSVAPARDWALRAVLAGHHNERRSLQLRDGNVQPPVELPAPDQFGTAPRPPISHSELQPGIGYIRFNDSLGMDETVGAFDRALADLRKTRALVVDLRDTASGGNTSVARGILGRFVKAELPYQKHVLPSEERDTGIRRSWFELVSPRGEFIYDRPVAVLVDHWTGSMGEGLAIGFDAVRTATVIGTPMAGLNGATYRVTLPNTNIGLNIPAERLYHVNGTPRETFQPKIVVDVRRSEIGRDPFIAAAMRSFR